MSVTKHKRYINKKVSEGICSRCNKPSFPYYDCSDCRFKKRLRYTLERSVKEGSLIKYSNGKYLKNQTFTGPSFVWYKVNPSGRGSGKRTKNESQEAFAKFVLKNSEIFTEDSVKWVLDQLEQLRNKTSKNK